MYADGDVCQHFRCAAIATRTTNLHQAQLPGPTPPPGPPTPPQAQIQKLALHLDQGESIYANGNMQAVVRIEYKLAPGVEMKRHVLRTYNTDDDIALSGWNISTESNGYDHNIGSSRMMASAPRQSEKSSFVTYYLSTDQANLNKICVMLQSEKEGVTEEKALLRRRYSQWLSHYYHTDTCCLPNQLFRAV